MKSRKTYMSEKPTNVKYVAPRRVHNIEEIVANEFLFQTGEGLPWHSHDEAHLTACISGSCIVRIENQQDTMMCSNTPSIILPPKIPHEIEALDSETIVINIYT